MKNKMKEIGRDNLAGVQYGDYQLYKGKFKAGTLLKLYHERNNPFDDQAIRVEYNGVKLGYIKRNSELYEALHEAKDDKRKVEARLISYNPTNPTWNMFTVAIKVEQAVDASADESF